MDHAAPDRSGRLDLLATSALVVLTCALHGHGLTLGFFFDDHTHLELCRLNGVLDLSAGNQFDWNGRIAHAWWAGEEMRWAYFRPLTVAMRCALFHVFGLEPFGFHVVHLGVLCLSAALFFTLLRRLGWGAGWAFTAAGLALANPANAITGAWLACDTSLLVGLGLVVGLLFFHASAEQDHRRPGLLVGTFVCYALAMLSRENGLMVGPILVLFDFCLALARGGPGHWKRRVAIYAGLAALGVAYLALRAWCLGDAPLPRPPYYHWPSEPGFFHWLAYKVLNEALCLPLGLPFVPVVDVCWWQARPLTSAAALLVVAGVAACVIGPLRRSVPAWGVLGGIALAQAPTEPAFSASYNYYLATVGWAVLLVMWARHLWQSRPRLVGGVLAGLAAWYVVGTWGGIQMVQAGAAADHVVREQVLRTGPESYPPGTRLFFINMPFLAIEVGPGLRSATGRDDLQVYPLTFAPDPFYAGTVVEVTREDDYTLLVRGCDGAFFSGGFGDEIQLGWYGARRRDLAPGFYRPRPAAGPLPFDVEIVHADAEGVWALRFRFDLPLTDPRNRFFLATHRGLANELRFGEAARDDFDERAAREPPTPEQRERERLIQRGRRMQMAARRVFGALSVLP